MGMAISLLLHNDSAAENYTIAIKRCGLAGGDGSEWLVEMNVEGVVRQ